MFSSTRTKRDPAGNAVSFYSKIYSSFLFSLIDTIGFDDPNNDTDANIISELVVKLKNNCDHVNLFIVAVNGQNPRLDASLVGMIKIIEGMFGEKFWSQVLLVFTRLQMDSKSIKRRTKNSDGRTDDDLGSD